MMKRWQPMSAAAGTLAILLIAAPVLAGTFNSGSTGADGAFNPTCAPTPCSVAVALPASGVFNFTTINIAAGITVKFTRNTTNTPVTMLATGDATIAGTINVDGQPGSAGAAALVFPNLGGAGGPGGFDGGSGGFAVSGLLLRNAGVGLGPGGGGIGSGSFCGGGGGGFGTSGSTGGCFAPGGPAYGNTQLLPLIGGSGGGGGGGTFSQFGPLTGTGGGGGGGGGAILVAASGTLTFTGTITARGGIGGPSACCAGGGGGAGGGVRLVATSLTGSGGTITVEAGAGSDLRAGASGAGGRIRIEAFNLTATLSVAGAGPTFAAPGVVFATTLPGLSIASVAGVAAPANPTGSYATPDITLPSNTASPVPVVVNATNIPDGTPVVLRATPQTGATAAATTPGLSGGTAQANLTLDLTQPSVISAQATFQIAAVDVPIKVAEAAGPDDPVTHARVSAAFGGPSQVAYITRAGREIAP